MRVSTTCQIVLIGLTGVPGLSCHSKSDPVGRTGGLSPAEIIGEPLPPSMPGDWVITRMDVRLAEAHADGRVVIDLRSQLEQASFHVHEDGTVTGEGSVRYFVDIEGGEEAPIPIPVHARAQLAAGESGIREFTISGQVELEMGVLELEPFEVQGDALQLAVIGPVGGSNMEFPPWPPMTSVSASGEIEGSTVLVRSSGTLERNITVAFEATNTSTSSLECAIQWVEQRSGVPLRSQSWFGDFQANFAGDYEGELPCSETADAVKLLYYFLLVDGIPHFTIDQPPEAVHESALRTAEDMRQEFYDALCPCGPDVS